jgi:AcrR family transcriptional regulator
MLSNQKEEKLDPRVKRTRYLLERAFIEVLNEKGFQAVSVQDITDRAGVNRATFYAHFEDKYALLDHSIRQWFRQEIEKRMLNACHFSMDNLRLLIVAVCEFVSHASSHCKPPSAKFESLMETQVKAQLQELLQAWIEQVGSDLDAKTGATAASWAIYGLALQWSRDKNHLPVEKFAEQVLPLAAANLKLAKDLA